MLVTVWCELKFDQDPPTRRVYGVYEDDPDPVFPAPQLAGIKLNKPKLQRKFKQPKKDIKMFKYQKCSNVNNNGSVSFSNS